MKEKNTPKTVQFLIFVVWVKEKSRFPSQNTDLQVQEQNLPITTYLQHSLGSSVLVRDFHKRHFIDEVVEREGSVEPVVNFQQTGLKQQQMG